MAKAATRVRKSAETPHSASVDPADVARFNALGEEWWDLWGPMRALHKLNPTRVAYIREILVSEIQTPHAEEAAQRPSRSTGKGPEARPSFETRPAGAPQDEGAGGHGPLSGLRLLDIGCGAGILSEPLAALGAQMTSVDPAPMNIEVAKAHAEKSGLSIDYRAMTAEELAETGAQYDAVLIMEVVEHVNDRSAFIATAASLVRPGGFLFAATLNRTAKSYALAIVGAEYIPVSYTHLRAHET